MSSGYVNEIVGCCELCGKIEKLDYCISVKDGRMLWICQTCKKGGVQF